MTQENKELLFKDLCARLPYGIKCEYHNLRYGGVFKVTDIRYNGYIEGVIDNKRCWAVFDTFALKPYLFPMSSMTEEQYKEYWELEHSGNMEHLSIPALDWLNKNNFDYRGLIDKSLALDATNLGIYE